MQDLEHKIWQKNKEIIYYLKEIEKLQVENDDLRKHKGGEGGSLASYKLKLMNKKLKTALKELMDKEKAKKQPHNT